MYVWSERAGRVVEAGPGGGAGGRSSESLERCGSSLLQSRLEELEDLVKQNLQQNRLEEKEDLEI